MSSKKILYSLEYVVRCSPGILYNFFTNPAGLQEWFCDNVNIREEVNYEFSWNGVIEKAKLIDHAENKYAKYRWEYQDKTEYFEFSISKSEITGQTILVIKDFADKKEMKDQQQLWEYQVKELLHRLGN